MPGYFWRDLAELTESLFSAAPLRFVAVIPRVKQNKTGADSIMPGTAEAHLAAGFKGLLRELTS